MSTSPRMVSWQLLILICFVFSVSGSIAVSNPHAAELFNASLIQVLFLNYFLIFCLPDRLIVCNIHRGCIIFGSCSYTVIITTSCSSTRYTRDQISLAFGDGYGNQIYAPRLDDPGKRAFERCSSDTYEINGPCAYQICYVYLHRSGPDGWVPESVKIFSHSSKAVTFSYNTHVPERIWYGFNYCNTISHSDSLAFGLGKLLLLVAVGLATLIW